MTNLQDRQPTVEGPGDWFTGDVYIDPIAHGQGDTPMSVGAVHFTPCARTGAQPGGRSLSEAADGFGDKLIVEAPSFLAGDG